MPQEVKIGYISAFSWLVKQVNSIARKNGYDIRSEVVQQEDIIPTGQKMEKGGVEVIICGRATADILRNTLNIPVLAFPITTMDVLRSVTIAAKISRDILVTIFKKRWGELDLLSDMLNIQIVQGIFQNENTLEDSIIKWKQLGKKVVVGGGLSLFLARKHGLMGVQYRYSEATISSVFENAVEIIKTKKIEQQISDRYRTIIESSLDGIVSINVEGEINVLNHVARQILKIDDKQVIGNAISHYFQTPLINKSLQDGLPRKNIVTEFNSRQYAVNLFPINSGNRTSGLIIILREVLNLVHDEQEIRRTLNKRLTTKYNIRDLVYSSQCMRDIVSRVRNYANSDSTVLITGETGTGKEIIAHSLHSLSHRREGPFVSINCTALPDQLLESELFGYEEGSFSGSRKGGKQGLFELAHNGTIFLDEIGSMPINLQGKLLRVLQEREIMRIGSDRLIPISVRVLAAANQDLLEEVRNNTFRKDLFFRLNILNIELPPLSKRIGDIPLLTRELIKRIAKNSSLTPFEIPERYIKQLQELTWPGNIRQLSNFIEKFTLLSRNGFCVTTFEELIREQVNYNTKTESSLGMPETPTNNFDAFSKKNELMFVLRTLKDVRWNKCEAAKKLGISRASLYRKLKLLSSENNSTKN